jgi:hypothetical protein
VTVVPLRDGGGPLRIANVTGGERCQRCDEEGLVVVGTEPRAGASYEVEVMGPCPDCERGFRVEHSGVWGADGFWRGRRPKQLGLGVDA